MRRSAKDFHIGHSGFCPRESVALQAGVGKGGPSSFFPPTIAPSWRWARPIYMISPAFAADKPFSLLHLHHSPSPPHQSASHFAIARARLVLRACCCAPPNFISKEEKKKSRCLVKTRGVGFCCSSGTSVLVCYKFSFSLSLNQSTRHQRLKQRVFVAPLRLKLH